MVPHGSKESQSIWHYGYGLGVGGGCPSPMANWYEKQHNGWERGRRLSIMIVSGFKLKHNDL